MITSPFDFFDIVRHRQKGLAVQAVATGERSITAATGERTVTFTIPPSWATVNQTPLTHEQKYGWNVKEARKAYGFGGQDGTPRFKGYFG